MKKYILGVTFSLALLASPAFTHAAALTQAQISSIIALLQSFGADSATIANVATSLGGGSSVVGDPQPWCHTFNTDLSFGSIGTEVSALNRALQFSGINIAVDTYTFNEDTAASVVQFQAKYGIRQTGYVGPITRAKLNALYGCPPALPPTGPPSITVLSPNGGETLIAGQTYTGSFGWNGFVPKNIKAFFINSTIGSGDLVTLGAISSSAAGDKSFSFTFPSFAQPSSDYKINVCDVDPTNSPSGKFICDSSDAPFSIVAAPNRLYLTVPNNGEKWQIGSVHTIQWTPYDPQNAINVVPTVSAYLERQVNGGFVTVGKVQEDGKASIHWSGSIGDTPQQSKRADQGEYYIRIVNSQTGEWDRSDVPFTLVVQNTVKADLKINGLDATSDAPFALPAGGGDVTLSWISANADSCKLYFNGLADDLHNLPTAGSKNVFLKPNPYLSGVGLLLVCESSIGSAGDHVFIAPANATSHITILSPNGGESINYALVCSASGCQSSTYPITWISSKDISKVSIALYKNDAFYRWISPDYSVQSTSGSMSWALPKIISDSDVGAGAIFKIYMIGYKSSGGTVEDKSDAPFSIVAAPIVSTPITLSSITPSSGLVGTSVRLDGCGSDSTSGFTLFYSGPRSGTAAIPVETLGAASGCGYMTFTVPTDFPAGTYTLSVKNNQTGAMSTNTVTFTVTAPAQPITLSSITPSSGLVGTSVRLDGCGSDSTSGFTLFYSGPRSGTAAIPVETLGAASGCGYMTFTVPTDFPAGTYTLSVKNNQTGAMSTNHIPFTVVAPSIVNNPVASVSPTSFGAGASFTSSVTGAAPNTQIRIFSTGPDGVTSEDLPAGTTNSSGAFSRTYNTTGWAVGNYRGWATVNGVQSNVATFAVTAPITGGATGGPYSLITPASGISLLTGSAQTIQWTGGDSGAVNLGLISIASNSVVQGIASGAPNTGSFSWMVPTFVNGQYRIYIQCSNCSPLNYAYGPLFNIYTSYAASAYTTGFGLASALGAFSDTGANGAAANQVSGTSGFSYVWNRDLQIGSPYADDIVALQHALTQEGVYAGEITGGFYNQTYTAVKAFQEKYGINATGYVGSLTRAKLNALYSK